MGAALVQLVEPVKDQRQFFRGDGIAAVAHGDIDLIAAHPDGDIQNTRFGTEFHSVIHQIVHHLGDGIAVCLGVHRIIREVHSNIQLLIRNLLLKGDQRLAHTFAQVKPGDTLRGEAFLSLHTGDVQHTPHQPAQPFGLAGHQAHIVAVLFRGDGAVQHTVHITGNGGHRGL